jgi:membrane protease YdiL (CAAX protease family)
MVFKNKHGELRSGWMLALVFAIMFMLQFFVGSVIGIIALLQAADPGNLAEVAELIYEMSASPVAMLVIEVVNIGLLLLLFRVVYKRPLRQMGFYKEGGVKQTLFGILFGAASISIAATVLLITGMAEVSGVNADSLRADSMFWFWLGLFVVVAFYEEIMTRGVMMTALKTTRNFWVIVLLPSVIFGVMHALNPNVTLFSLVNIALVGVLFSYLFIKTGRLWAPIGYHFAWNFIQGNIYGIPVSGLEAPSLMAYHASGPEWLTGGAFGVEGGAIATAVIVLGLAFTHFCIKQPDHLWRIDSDMPLTRGAAKPEVAVEEATEAS